MTPAGVQVKGRREMDDPKSRFWEQLIGDWVGTVVLAFVLQGLWFGLVSVLVGMRSELGEPLARASTALGIPWLLGIVVGLLWGLKRALDVRAGAGRRR